VLDGELCAWKDGRLAFGLLRAHGPRGSRASRADAVGVSLALVVFDVLALPGRDVRPLPLRQRVALLEGALQRVPPAIQPIMATTDPAQARTWYAELEPVGIEGLVCKALDSPYQARAAGTPWVKIRHQDTLDATVTAITGTPRRPRHLVLRLPDASVVLTSPQLDASQARGLADALANRLGEAVDDPAFGTLYPLQEPVTVEVLAGTGRHATYRYLRLRAD
jgi:bifunctional non-homologous end joining protein LigD